MLPLCLTQAVLRFPQLLEKTCHISASSVLWGTGCDFQRLLVLFVNINYFSVCWINQKADDVCIWHANQERAWQKWEKYREGPSGGVMLERNATESQGKRIPTHSFLLLFLILCQAFRVVLLSRTQRWRQLRNVVLVVPALQNKVRERWMNLEANWLSAGTIA